VTAATEWVGHELCPGIESSLTSCRPQTSAAVGPPPGASRNALVYMCLQTTRSVPWNRLPLYSSDRAPLKEAGMRPWTPRCWQLRGVGGGGSDGSSSRSSGNRSSSRSSSSSHSSSSSRSSTAPPSLPVGWLGDEGLRLPGGLAPTNDTILAGCALLLPLWPTRRWPGIKGKRHTCSHGASFFALPRRQAPQAPAPATRPVNAMPCIRGKLTLDRMTPHSSPSLANAPRRRRRLPCRAPRRRRHRRGERYDGDAARDRR
jgi:hypothetical protein